MHVYNCVNRDFILSFYSPPLINFFKVKKKKLVGKRGIEFVGVDECLKISQVALDIVFSDMYLEMMRADTFLYQGRLIFIKRWGLEVAGNTR